MKAMGDFVGGTAAMEAGKFTRKVMKINAKEALADGASAQVDARKSARIFMGEQVGRQAASGFQVGSGSPLDALRESAIESELEVLRIDRQARTQARNYKNQGSQAFASGYNQMVGSYMSGVAKLMPTPEGGE